MYMRVTNGYVSNKGKPLVGGGLKVQKKEDNVDTLIKNIKEGMKISNAKPIRRFIKF